MGAVPALQGPLLGHACTQGLRPRCPGGVRSCFCGRRARPSSSRPGSAAEHLSVGSRLARPGRLRELLAAPEPLVAPGAYDALSARLIEQAGFGAVYMTGFGTTASLIGRPDVGLLSATEMIDNAGRIAAAVDVPVIADADTGYGNAINVVRTVQAFEQAGAAGIYLEDQVAPKRCGHLSGKAVIPASEMAEKIRAAVAARRDPDFVIIARTDAIAVNGLDDAVARAAPMPMRVPTCCSWRPRRASGTSAP